MREKEDSNKNTARRRRRLAQTNVFEFRGQEARIMPINYCIFSVSTQARYCAKQARHEAQPANNNLNFTIDNTSNAQQCNIKIEPSGIFLRI